MYSLSMVIVEACPFLNSIMRRCSNLRLQLVTGKIPFYRHSNGMVSHLVLGGTRPLKPDPFDAPGMTPQVWKIAEECWHGEAQRRPDAKAVLQRLENVEAEAGVCTPGAPVATRVD